MKAYYIKMRGFNDAINELIMAKLAPFCNLLCPNIKIIKLSDDDGYYRVLSSNLALLGEFTLAKNILKDDEENNNKKEEAKRNGYISLYDIWNTLEKDYPNADRLMMDVVRMYLFDFFMANYDRHSGNWGILKNGPFINVAILDNEDSFDATAYSRITANLDANAYYKELYKKGELSFFKKNQKEIKRFLQDSSYEFILLFKELLDTLTPALFTSVLDDIETNEYILVDNVDKVNIKIPYKNSLIDIYTKRYNMLLDLYNELKISNKR